MKLPIRTLSLTTVATLMLLACGKQTTPSAASSGAATPAQAAVEIIRIGHVGPLTGSIAHLGKDNENGAGLAIEEANAQGVEIGGHKVSFELLAEDDQADPKVGTTVAQKLIDAKIAGIVGHLLAKGRLLGAQMLGWLRDGHWLELARHANRQAAQLARRLRLPLRDSTRSAKASPTK